jgi:hypothetical protein
MDAEATVVKSDTAISPELREQLLKHAFKLENIPEKHKDWHPGSDEKVLDLLHPSLFPLIFGVSKVLRNGTVPLETCDEYTGKGETTSGPGEQDERTITKHSWNDSHTLKVWGSYQWLPSDIHFEKNGEVKITSYINNLHPKAHGALYKVLEQFVDRSIPLWNEALSWFHDRIRIPILNASDEDFELPEGVKYERPPPSEGNEDSDVASEDLEYDDDYQDWKREHRVLIQPEPRKFVPNAKQLEKEPLGALAVDLRKKFADSGIQVIFKLANIHLTPEKPEYDGGSWHVEGALNEHICATALYYYDEQNVTESHLGFRQSMNVEEMTMKPQQVTHPPSKICEFVANGFTIE